MDLITRDRIKQSFIMSEARLRCSDYVMTSDPKKLA